MSRLAISLLLLVGAAFGSAKPVPPSPEVLAKITEHGRRIAAYDRAAWHATDAVLALSPAKGAVKRYIAKQSDGGWTVAFGRINDAGDAFLVVYEAVPGKQPD